MFFGRLGAWVAAIFIAFLPVILGIATTPRGLAGIMATSKLLPFYRDLMFSIIAVLCISIIDGSEVLLRKDYIFAGRRRPASIIILLLCILICILCAAWSAGSITPNLDDIEVLLNIIWISLAAALVQRVLLIFGD